MLALVVSGFVHARIAGPATVTDGDSITVSGQRICLFALDAPESKWTCVAGGRRWGQSATRALRQQLDGRSVVCTARDRYGRVVAVCRVGAEDINAWMVSQGMAVAYTKYSRAYVAQERSA